MHNLPYIEPTIRSIAGALVTLSGVLLYTSPEWAAVSLALLLFVSINLFQSGFTSFCLMEKLLKKIGLRSEMDEIKSLSSINADHLDTLNLLNEVVVELSTEGNLVRLTDSWGKLLGCSTYSASSGIGKAFIDFVSAEDRDSVVQVLAQSKVHEVNSVRFRMAREDGREHWIEAKFTLYSENRSQPMVRGVLRDVTESYLQEAQISHMAMHDALTGLPNRILLDDRMGHAISQARRTGLKVALLFIDLDNFKQVNDVHGHKAGDQLLIAIARILKDNVRDSDTLARWGGDEFVALLQGQRDVSEAYAVAEKLLAAIQKETVLEHVDTLVTFSIGMAVFPEDADSGDTLLVHADRALFYAKAQGRNNVQIYGQLPTMG